MPIYEYHCEPCNHDFEAIVRSASDVPRCPKCGEPDHLVKQFSVPASARVGSGGGSPCGLPSGSPAPCGTSCCNGGMCGLS